MPKPRKTLRVRLPAYVAPRLKWRRLMEQAIRDAQARQRVLYDRKDKIEVRVRLYFRGRALDIHDLDNRLKDILDTLQGRLGGPKRRKPRFQLIPNDNQIWRIIADKEMPPPQSHGLSHLALRVLPK